MINDYYTTTFSIYRVSSSVDVNNFLIETMSLFSTSKGFFEPLSGNERYLSDRKQLHTTHRLFSPVINATEKDEIHMGSNTYDIDLIQNFQNNHLEYILIERK